MICAYDNPETKTRDCWAFGKLRLSVSWTVYALKDEYIYPKYFNHIDLRYRFIDGQIVGNKSAMMQND